LSDALTFRQGDPKWTALRQKCLSDLFFFNQIVLGYGDLFPLQPETHLLFHRFMERRTGSEFIDEAGIQLVMMPRGTGKTTCGTRGHAIQLACANPNISILIANERQENANAFLSEIKAQFEHNDLLRALFPEVIPDFRNTTWAAEAATLKRDHSRPEPTFLTIGVGGTVTGMHFDVILCDDLISRDAMENARAGAWGIMDKTNRWVNQLKPLLNPQAQPFPWIRFIGTSWWKDDTYAYLEKAFTYEEARQSVRLSAKLPTGGSVSHNAWRAGELAVFKMRAEEGGKAVFPHIYDLDELARLRQLDPELYACLPMGQPILTSDGYRNIECVAVGDNVVTHLGNQRKVEAVNIRPYQGTLVSIFPYGQASPSRVTANHKLWVQPAKTYAFAAQRLFGDYAEPEWIRADEVRVGDVVSVPIDATELPLDSLAELERQPDFWFLVGHFLGDGTINKQGAVQHCFNKRDRALANRVSGIVRTLYGRKARLYEDRTTTKFIYRHPHAAKFFKELVHGIGQKWLPSKYEQLPFALQQELIAGYWAADGCVLPNGRKAAVSVCAPLLWQLQRVFARLGSVAYMGAPRANTTNIEGRSVTAQPIHMLWLYPDTKRKRKVWIENGRLYRRVRKITQEAFSGPVFNCQVEDAHSYVAATNALSYANCNFLNDPVDAAVRTFQDDWLRYYKWIDNRIVAYRLDDGSTRHISTDDLSKVLICDPAFTATGQGARSAIVVVGTDLDTGKHLVLDAIAARVEPGDLLQDILNTALLRKVKRVFIEAVAQQIGFINHVQSEAVRRNLAISIETVKPGGRNKDIRIESLSSHFRSGSILLNSNMLDFLREYSSFRPGSRLKDLLDALAYASEVWVNVGHPNTVNPSDTKARRRDEMKAYYQRRGMPAASAPRFGNEW